MKHLLLLLLSMIASSIYALPLSQQARGEAKLFNDFLNAVYAQRKADPARFALLQRVLAQVPDSAYIKQQLVSEALAADKPQLAEPYLDYIDQETQDPEAWVIYGVYQWKTNHPAQALEAYEKALELNPDDERILLQYISLLAALDPQKAVQTLTQLAQSRPLSAPAIYTEIGRVYLYHQQFPQALEAFNKAVSLDDQDVQPRLGRVAVYEKTNQYFLMLHELEELEKSGYTTAQTLAQMGSIFVLVKDFPRAQHYFLRAKEQDKHSVPANYFLSLFAEQEGKYDQAIAYLKDGEDYAQSPAKQLQVSFYQHKLGQLAQSMQTLKQAHTQFADNAEIAYFYAVALYEQKEYKKSARVLAPIVEQLPENQEVRLQYAFALEGQKKYRDMEEQLKILLEQNARHAGALNLLAYSLALRGERLDEAADYIARALAINPEDYSFIDTQAWVFYKQGRLEQAADVMGVIPKEVLAANDEMAYHAAYIYGKLEGRERMTELFRLGCADQNPKTCLQEFKKLR